MNSFMGDAIFLMVLRLKITSLAACKFHQMESVIIALMAILDKKASVKLV